MSEYRHSLKQVAIQLKEQLASEKRKLGFFFGAGSSMAIGIPGVFALTKAIAEKLTGKEKDAFEKLRASAGSDNIEYILNKLRTVRELIGESEEESFYGVTGKTEGQSLDIAICKAISEIVHKTEIKEIIPHLIFSNWLFQNQSTRYSPIEIFTTNYDLIIEQALEHKKIPFFDGFVGSINPFLIPECIEAENTKIDQASYIPYSWVRLWKIHGSINWFLSLDKENKRRIIRCTNRELTVGDELMIYPSKQKYDESRRLPFLVFQDRLRKFLSSGETLLVIIGYSFGDDHLNEILLQALRSNKRLAITALMFGEAQTGTSQRVVNPKVLSLGLDNPNLSIIGPDQACIGGVISEWSIDTEVEKLVFWDKESKNCDLGNFAVLAKYLQMNFGIINSLIESQNEE